MSPPRNNRNAKAPPRWWGIPIVLCGLAVGLVVGQFEPETIAKALANSTAAILFAALIFWRCRVEIWYWMFLVVMLLAHVGAAFIIPWPHGDPPSGHKDVFLLFGVVDVIVTLSLGFATAKLARTKAFD